MKTNQRRGAADRGQYREAARVTLPAALVCLRIGVAMAAGPSMTAEQAVTLKRLAKAAYELDAFKPNLTREEANLRIAGLTAKLKLLGDPPHTL
jgi:hypothetical protein